MINILIGIFTLAAVSLGCYYLGKLVIYKLSFNIFQYLF